MVRIAVEARRRLVWLARPSHLIAGALRAFKWDGLASYVIIFFTLFYYCAIANDRLRQSRGPITRALHYFMRTYVGLGYEVV